MAKDIYAGKRIIFRLSNWTIAGAILMLFFIVSVEPYGHVPIVFQSPWALYLFFPVWIVVAQLENSASFEYGLVSQIVILFLGALQFLLFGIIVEFIGIRALRKVSKPEVGLPQ